MAGTWDWCSLGRLVAPAGTGVCHEELGLQPQHCTPPLGAITAPQLACVQLSVGTCGDSGWAWVTLWSAQSSAQPSEGPWVVPEGTRERNQLLLVGFQWAGEYTSAKCSGKCFMFCLSTSHGPHHLLPPYKSYCISQDAHSWASHGAWYPSWALQWMCFLTITLLSMKFDTYASIFFHPSLKFTPNISATLWLWCPFSSCL